MDKIVDKHSDFCRRLMNKGLISKYKNPLPVYVIIEQTEIMCDYYKKICSKVQDEKLDIDISLIKLLSDVNATIKEIYNTFFKFESENIIKIGEFETNIKNDIEKLLKKQKKDTEILFYIAHIFEVGFEMKSALLTAFV